MFEIAEVGSKVEKQAYEKRLAKLRTELLAVQRRLAVSPLRLLVLVGGVEGGGKTELARLFLGWMDPRGLQVEAYGDPERDGRPEYWRYWNTLPMSGRGALLVGTWYTRPIVERVFHRLGRGGLERALDRVVEFETMLIREGTVLVKLWLHLSKEEQRRRFKELESDPATSWRVTKQDWKFSAKYDRFRKVCEHVLAKTGTGAAPWTVIEATDFRHRNLAAGETVLAAVQGALERAEREKAALRPDRPKPPKVSVLSRLDLRRALDDEDYEDKLLKQQARLARLTRGLRDTGRSLVAVFEGVDAAGKGGAIRRLVAAVDARSLRVHAVAAPTDEEKARPYLWRFWRELPSSGRVAIFDRSWYGRVLVERIEGFCAEDDWKRAFAEISGFEEQLADSGAIVCKFWLQISAEEQLRRFKDRVETPFKQFKITAEDWRNREKWDAYQAAAVEMTARTSTPEAPWTLVEAEDKRWARVKVLKTIADRLKDEL